jgi:hypothetical protein
MKQQTFKLNGLEFIGDFKELKNDWKKQTAKGLDCPLFDWVDASCERAPTPTSTEPEQKYKTVRDLVKLHPEMWDYHYKWRGTESPELEKDLPTVLSGYGYKLKDDFDCDYNDLKGYLECEVIPTTHQPTPAEPEQESEAKPIYKATVDIVFEADPNNPGEACDAVSAMLTENLRQKKVIVDWQYHPVNGTYPEPVYLGKFNVESLEEGEPFPEQSAPTPPEKEAIGEHPDWKYSPHFKDDAQGHVFSNDEDRMLFNLIAPAAATQKQLNKDAKKFVDAVNAYPSLVRENAELFQMVRHLKSCVKRLAEDDVSQFERDTEAQWEGEAHELLVRINPNYYRNANEKQP